MTQKTICHSNKKEFIRFLKEEGVYVAFKRNFSIDYIRKWFIVEYEQIISGRNYYEVIKELDYISKAFYWRGTPEGYDFWLGINKRWVSLVYEKGVY